MYIYGENLLEHVTKLTISKPVYDSNQKVNHCRIGANAL